MAPLCRQLANSREEVQVVLPLRQAPSSTPQGHFPVRDVLDDVRDTTACVFTTPSRRCSDLWTKSMTSASSRRSRARGCAPQDDQTPDSCRAKTQLCLLRAVAECGTKLSGRPEGPARTLAVDRSALVAGVQRQGGRASDRPAAAPSATPPSPVATPRGRRARRERPVAARESTSIAANLSSRSTRREVPWQETSCAPGTLCPLSRSCVWATKAPGRHPARRGGAR